MLTLKDRFYGSAVGTLAGDAVLAPYETAFYVKGRRAKIAEQLAAEGPLHPHDYIEPFKGKRQIKAGHPTDDSELAYALGASIIAAGGFDAKIAYLYLRDFIHGNNDENIRRSYLTDGEAYGSGGTLRSGLRERTYEASLHVFREGRVSVIPSNGSLMRMMAVPLAYVGRIGTMVEVARKQSCLTHIHPDAQACCITYAIFVEHLLNEATPSEAWDRTLRHLASLNLESRKSPDKILSKSLVQVMQLPLTLPSEDEMELVGSAMLSLRIALWATVEAKDFVDGMEKVVRVGGDTDTYGAIAGGMLGAHFGIESIPPDWQRQLIGFGRMVALADKFLEK
jgi:ADP-ribosyl-[dinitrogen reductase] hydrolase